MDDPQSHELRVFLTDSDVARSSLTLESLLQLKGITTTAPYTTVAHPWMAGHFYIQRVRTETPSTLTMTWS